MSLWERVKCLRPEALQIIFAHYGDHLPIEVRSHLPNWIEDAVWKADMDAVTFYNGMLKQLEIKANALLSSQPFESIKLSHSIKNLQHRYSRDPSSLFRVVNECINTEKRMVEEAEYEAPPYSPFGGSSGYGSPGKLMVGSPDNYMPVSPGKGRYNGNSTKVAVGNPGKMIVGSPNKPIIGSPSKLIVGSPGKAITIGSPGKAITIGSPGKAITIGSPGKGINIGSPGKGITVGSPGKGITVGSPGKAITVKVISDGSPEAPAGGFSYQSAAQISEIALMTNNLRVTKAESFNVADTLKRTENELEAFIAICHELQKLEGLLGFQRQQAASPQATLKNMSVERDLIEQKKRLENKLREKANGILFLNNYMKDTINQVCKNVSEIQKTVLLKHLYRWKCEQQSTGNEASFTIDLDQIQSWCEELAELIWNSRQQLQEAERQTHVHPSLEQCFRSNGEAGSVAGLQEQVTKLLTELVNNAWVFEVQPAQVLKTSTRFPSPVIVRFLVGGMLNIHMKPPQVKVEIINEEQATLLKKSGNPISVKSGVLLNNSGKLELNKETRHHSVMFRNINLKSIVRKEKKNVSLDAVTDEKFALYCQSEFSVADVNFKVWTLSLPIVVVSHGSQEPRAWATIRWYNALGEKNTIPYKVPERVRLHHITEMLNGIFVETTGKGLSEDNLQYLAEKVSRNKDYVTWNEFCKDCLPDKNFSFWEWFYAALKLVEKCLKQHWVDGCIMGFVDKIHAELLLANSPPGTFLLRFSDSMLGGITIGWLHCADEQVYNLNPYIIKDLTAQSLADKIYDLPQLNYLYPRRPKEEAFRRNFNSSASRNSGGRYVKPIMRTYIPGMDMKANNCNSCASSSTSININIPQQNNHTHANNSHANFSVPDEIDSCFDNDAMDITDTYPKDLVAWMLSHEENLEKLVSTTDIDFDLLLRDLNNQDGTNQVRMDEDGTDNFRQNSHL